MGPLFGRTCSNMVNPALFLLLPNAAIESRECCELFSGVWSGASAKIESRAFKLVVTHKIWQLVTVISENILGNDRLDVVQKER